MEATQQPKEWSNPTAAGLVALAVACGCFFALLTGRVGPGAMPLIAGWLMGGFIVQFVVGLIDLKGGNHTGGNTFLFFCAFFMLAGSLGMWMKYAAIQAGTPLDARVDGYAWGILTLVVFTWTPAFFTKFSLLSVLVVLLDIALPFITLVDLGLLPHSALHIPAWALLAAGVVGVYFSAAIVVNNAFGRVVYPLPGAGKK